MVRRVTAQEVGPAGMVGLIRDSLGLDLRAAMPLGRGQGRTYLCRLGDEDVVVKWGLDPDLAEKLPYVAGQIGELSRRGCQVPAIIAHGPLPVSRAPSDPPAPDPPGSGRASTGQGYAWVQQHLPGEPATMLDSALLSDLVELSGRWAGRPAGPHRGSYTAWVPAVVFHDETGWWANAQAASPVVAEFCRRLQTWVGEPAATTTRHDYVHGDLNLQNVLVVDGRLAGVVDLEGLGTGDRSVDIARLLFEWHRLARTGQPGLASGGADLLAALGRDIAGEAVWRQSVAYELIGRLGWRSHHHLDVDVPAVLATCVDVLHMLP